MSHKLRINFTTTYNKQEITKLATFSTEDRNLDLQRFIQLLFREIPYTPILFSTTVEGQVSFSPITVSSIKDMKDFDKVVVIFDGEFTSFLKPFLVVITPADTSDNNYHDITILPPGTVEPPYKLTV
eukprot:Phypoly_transcript_17954.p1 GENE.Phypoly_transcript_17954~~Phypoly_transcript_17954.p1  ORF type:complete len:148 (+),score=11.55 Phypoly_transcript_17954:66-446(+)